MKSIELFSGAGGLALGIQRAGCDHQLLVENDPFASETLRLNLKAGLIQTKDLSGLNTAVEEVQLDTFRGAAVVAAGIPCQPFSHAGKRRGVDDVRNALPAFTAALATVRPQAFVLENVSGLMHGHLAEHLHYAEFQLRFPAMRPATDEPWRRHLTRLESSAVAGDSGDGTYEVTCEVLNAADYGVPQTRRRVFSSVYGQTSALRGSLPSRLIPDGRCYVTSGSLAATGRDTTFARLRRFGPLRQCSNSWALTTGRTAKRPGSPCETLSRTFRQLEPARMVRVRRTTFGSQGRADTPVTPGVPSTRRPSR